MSYDVPGGGKPGSTFVDRSTWTVPFSARILSAASHHHGGATHQTLSARRATRTLMDASAYYGAADHPYNTIRPILHEPGPIANGTFHTAQGIPIAPARCSSAPPITPTTDAARRRDGLLGPAAGPRRLADRVRADADRPDARCSSRRTTTRKAPFVYDRVVPQLYKPTGDGGRSPAAAVAIGDR